MQLTFLCSKMSVSRTGIELACPRVVGICSGGEIAEILCSYNWYFMFNFPKCQEQETFDDLQYGTCVILWRDATDLFTSMRRWQS